VFVAAYRLRNSGLLPEHEYDRLFDLLCWFGENLKVPRRFSKSGFAPERAICWFKSSAQMHIAAAWELADILEQNDILVRALKTERPGYIAYEDDAQVAAIPFRDTNL